MLVFGKLGAGLRLKGSIWLIDSVANTFYEFWFRLNDEVFVTWVAAFPTFFICLCLEVAAPVAFEEDVMSI